MDDGEDGMTDTSTSKHKHCAPHSWRIIDTLINRVYGIEGNPVFSLECRKCGARTKAKGRVSLRALVSLSTKKGVG